MASDRRLQAAAIDLVTAVVRGPADRWRFGAAIAVGLLIGVAGGSAERWGHGSDIAQASDGLFVPAGASLVLGLLGSIALVMVATHHACATSSAAALALGIAGGLLLATAVVPAQGYPPDLVGSVRLRVPGIPALDATGSGRCAMVADGSAVGSVEAASVLFGSRQLSVRLEFDPRGQAVANVAIGVPGPDEGFYSSRESRTATVKLNRATADRAAGLVDFTGLPYEGPWRVPPASIPIELAGSLEWACWASPAAS